MAFSFRKIISNIGYFKKPGDPESCSSPSFGNDLDLDDENHRTQLDEGDALMMNLERTEPDSTSIQNSGDYSSVKLPPSLKNITVKKGSLSDTDLLGINVGKKERKRSKKLKIDVKKANQSFDDNLNKESIENTPKHVLLECKSSEIFSERMKKFDFSKSFEIDSDTSSFEEENIDIESLSEDEMSLDSKEDNRSIKMCRKVGEGSNSSLEQVENQLVPATSLESFADVEIDKNEEERMTLLLNYQLKLEKMESVLKKLFTEFQFHIEVSKIFNSKSFVTILPGTEVSHIPKLLGEVSLDNIQRGVSPSGSWNILMEKEDSIAKKKLKNQLLSIQASINHFITTNLKQSVDVKKRLTPSQRSITYDLHKGSKIHKKVKINNKKRIKHFDFPDIRDAMLNLFCPGFDVPDTIIEEAKCVCNCHSPSQADSGLTNKSEERSMSITSSIGNFTLDTSTLTAYSESLDQIISYNSFQDTSLYSALVHKAAIERITFYVQVHSIQMKCEASEEDFESKNIIMFHCPACKTTEHEENGLLKHILSQRHCEKIHFLYKTAYIKKCVASAKEIQPSTVLNPMKMYRDDNKIVCFGDAVYACSLCFENLIVGESVLMSHCMQEDHVARRDRLSEILE